MNQKSIHTLEFNKIIQMLEPLASTQPGKEKCRSLQPMANLDEINQAQRETSDACDRIRLKGSISFSGVSDIQDSCMRLKIGSALTLPELIRIGKLLDAAGRARRYGQREEGEEPDSLDGLFCSLDPLSSLQKELKRCILSEEEISDEASPALKKIRRAIQNAQNRIHTQLTDIVNSSRAYLQDGVVTMRNGRYCIPVKAEYKNHISGMVHDQSSSGSTFFIEPMSVVRLNNEIRQLELEEQKEIQIILAGLSDLAGAHTDALLTDFQVLSQLDFIFAKAALSRRMKGTRPLFNAEGKIHIKQGRHPLLDTHRAVPIDIMLGEDFNLLIITGPNTGGKTVSLKTIGLFTVMGQAGLHIPAFEGSRLSVFQEVYADIGDEQSIEQSLSTFSSHMTHIVEILEKADTDSLVLLDELGAGTDPVEGAALAMSILSYLHKLGVPTMATTHYSELKLFALSTKGVENASCEFDVETLRPTYRLLIGIPGKSNAFAISKKLGLPEHLIEDARAFIGEQDEAFEDVISQLNKSRAELEREKAQLERYRLETEQLKKELSEKTSALKERKDKILTDARAEASQILQDAKDFADQSISRITRLSQNSGLNKELEKERSSIRNKLNQTQSKAQKQSRPRKEHKAEDFKIGDKVKVLTLNVDGIVTSLPNAKGNLTVQMGILRSQVNIKDLELIEETTITGDGVSSMKSRSKERGHASQIKMSKSLSISPEINLIGMTTDQAVPEMEKYLDDAYLAGLHEVRVVHGRGTGALRSAVQNRLKRLKYVKSYRLGTFGEGDTGVTIVTFDTKGDS